MVCKTKVLVSRTLSTRHLFPTVYSCLFPFNLKHKTNSGYKHNHKAHFNFDSTFRMLQHTALSSYKSSYFIYIIFEFVQPSLLKMYVVAYQTSSQK